MEDEEEIVGSPTPLTKGGNEIPTITYGEVGNTGLITLGGEIFEEIDKQLRWPEAAVTFKKMAKDGAIHPALDFVESKIASVGWVVKIPDGYEESLKEKAEFLSQQMTDMTHSWVNFIQQVSSFNRMGFCVNEKVYRYRYKKNGSKYDDGLVGIKKLPIRSQDSITEWAWKSKELSGLYQKVTEDKTDTYRGWSVSKNQETKDKFIPRKKFLLFRHNPQKDSPVGASPLIGIHASWVMKKAYEEAESLAVAQDSNAFKILFLPPEYMTEDATPDRKAAFEIYKKMLANAHLAKQSGFILPMLTDDQGNKMFDFEIKNISGTKSYDINKIIQRFTSEIQVGLYSDVLGLGGDGGGSFALSEVKLSILEMAVKSRLNEIKSQLNHDLVPQLFELNGWDTTVLPYFDFEQVADYSLDEVSKYFQRLKATGLVPVVPQVINHLMKKAGIDYVIPDDISQEDLDILLKTKDASSESGAGFEQGMGNTNGNSTEGSGDSSVSNTENA